MIRAQEGESSVRSGKAERITSLLLHDLAHLPSHLENAIGASLTSRGQVTFNFDEPHVNGVGQCRLVGFDEAGRGALAGPVTVACVSFDLADACQSPGVLNKAFLEAYQDLNDSKKVAAQIRVRLFDIIKRNAEWGIGFASAIEIDRIGIVPACQLAARRAYRRLGIPAKLALFDRGLSLGVEATASAFTSACQITKGDATSFHIAAASILAKVRRDMILSELGSRSDAYGFASHKGYGSAAHIAAIQQHGTSRFHRKSFLTRIC